MAEKFLNNTGLSYFYGRIKTIFALKSSVPTQITRSGTTFTAKNSEGTQLFTFTQQDNTVSKTTTTPKMNGTAAIGSETKYAAGDHVHPTDTSRASAESVDDLEGRVDTLETDIDRKVDKVTGKGLSTNDYTTDEKNKLAGISAGAEVNQNAFSNVKVGSTTVAADAKTDTLELAAGSNVTLTPDATNDKVTIAATDTKGFTVIKQQSDSWISQLAVGENNFKAGANISFVLQTNAGSFNEALEINATDTKNTTGATDSSSKLFIIGAQTQAAQPQTYSQDTAYVGTDGHLYSNSKQTVNLSDSQALTNKTYNGYTLAAACAKAVDTSISAGSSSTNVPTSAAVESRISAAIADAQIGAATFQGTISDNSTISGSTSYKKGMYWVVSPPSGSESVVIAGQTCEAGDMVFCVSDYNSSYKASDFSIVQNNMDMKALTTQEIDAIIDAA